MNRNTAHLTKLNLGCGNDIRPDFVILDIAPFAGALQIIL
jgi:hypothetical protein